MMRREMREKIQMRAFFLACVPLGGCVRVHHPSCVHPGADRVQSTQRFLLHRRPTPRYSFLNPKHLGRFLRGHTRAHTRQVRVVRKRREGRKKKGEKRGKKDGVESLL